MTKNDKESLPELIQDLLGYLNFSSGNRDPRFFVALNRLYEILEAENAQKKQKGKADKPCLAVQVIERLERELSHFAEENEAFRVDDQAGLALRLVREHLLPEYRLFHADLLFHQTDDFLFNPFFLAKAFEAVFRQGRPWTEHERIVPKVIEELNDYIGYRPTPVLEGEEKHLPDAHEWVTPIPLYVDGIGVAAGKYRKIVEHALDILKETDPQILYEACFSLERLEELVLDPRAYDFDHPVNRKPNYHFGLWDPQYIDKKGFYRRFVVHQVTIDGILHRLETAYTGESTEADTPMADLLYEAGSVLVGTMLMGSGVCGDTPQTYDSETSLGDLMPMIAGYRDRFYEQLLDKAPAKMRPRLRREEQRLFQPFGGCRQNLNKQLAKRRADQLQRMHLARIFARMGYFEAAEHQTDIILVASARILTKIDCLITEAHFLIDRHELEESAEQLPKIEDLIHRGIACGAIVDPWTILGFGANFSLFHSVENSIHDHRVDDFINLLEEIFDLYSRLQKEAAAAGKDELQADLSDRMSNLAGWWDQFGSTDVSGLDSFSGNDAWESAAKVATSLAVWHKAGTSAGDVAFWNRHVERFNSTKAYVLLAEALLDQRDPVASMALMMHWLSLSDTIALTEGDYSFHSIALRWMEQLWKSPKENSDEEDDATPKRSGPALTFTERWNLTKKFFDYIEANADRYWRVPEIELSEDHFEKESSERGPGGGRRKMSGSDFLARWMENELDKDDEENDDESKQNFDDLMAEYLGDEDDEFDSVLIDDLEDLDGDPGDDDFTDVGDDETGIDEEDDSGAIDPLYSAAYENVTYHDTADDGVEDSMMESQSDAFRDGDDLELATETDRISDRLTFIVTMAKLWKFATEKIAAAAKEEIDAEEPGACLDAWLKQIVVYGRGLEALLARVSTYKVPPPRGTADSLLEYDRHRGTKEILLDRIIWTHVEVRDAKMILESWIGPDHWQEVDDAWEKAVLEVVHDVFHGRVKAVRRRWESMLRALSKETILYVPTSRGGSAAAIVRCRCIQQAIMRLMEYAPRLGLLPEAFRILETIQIMEELNPVSPGAITEFDRLVETATRAITQCISLSSRKWRFRAGDDDTASSPDVALVEYMEQMIELLLSSWLSHSKQIRISPVESLTDRAHWDDVKAFIQRYGHDIFTQQHMGFGNLRAMLHQGVDNYLRSLIRIKEDDGEVEMGATLIEDIENGNLDWDTAVAHLEIILETIAENYSEYVDYNSTTTHSDHGEKLYMLIDMLRVQIGYERISWNLKPVYWVHDAMIRAGCDDAALLWERAVARKSINAAEEYVRQYNRLSEKYGMWIPSVHERLQERFVRPLQVDRMCGLVPKAIRQARKPAPRPAFALLYDQIEVFAKEPMGVGFEMPEWLTALQDEVMATRTDTSESEKERDVYSSSPHFEQSCLTRNQLEKVLEALARRERE